MVTVVDAVNGLATLDAHPESVRQAAVADRLVLTKRSLADAETVEHLMARLRVLNPRAVITDAESDTAAASLLVNGLYDPETKHPDVSRWLQEETPTSTITTTTMITMSMAPIAVVAMTTATITITITITITMTTMGIIAMPMIFAHSPFCMTSRSIRMAIEMFVDLLRSAHGEKLLRMKAVVQTSDRPRQAAGAPWCSEHLPSTDAASGLA